MSLLDKIFGSKNNPEKEEEKRISWVSLSSMQQLDDIERQSSIKPQVIFKHSTTCGISRMVLNMFSKSQAFYEGRLDFYFLDLHKFRQLSGEIGNRFNVRHQSPQLLVIKNGEVAVHDSHGAITEIKLENYI